MINLLMPMGGGGVRFFKDGFKIPKPLIEIQGKPFFFWAAQSIKKFIQIKQLVFVVLQEHIDQFQIDEKILQYYPEARIQVLDYILNGAVLTCLEGIKLVENDAPVVFNDCDHAFLSIGFFDYCNSSGAKNWDGALLTFASREAKYSYAQVEPSGKVLKTVEKQVISDRAICGAYYFKNKTLFAESAEKYLEDCRYEEYFMSGVYNTMIGNGHSVGCFNTDLHLSFGTPEEYCAVNHAEQFQGFL